MEQWEYFMYKITNLEVAKTKKNLKNFKLLAYLLK